MDVPIDIESRLKHAVQQFWLSRQKQQKKQIESGKIDAGTRGAVTGGTQMGALEVLIRDILVETGLKETHIKTRTALELPGYYRPEKKWDLIVVSENKLVLAMEFKSQVGPSFGNNFNNRSEEAIGSASDIWVAHREGRFGDGPAPFLGYLFLLEDCTAVHRPVKNSEPYFHVDPVFKDVSYSKRYELLGRRLMRERLYTAACLLMSTNSKRTRVTQPAEDLSFAAFVAALRGHIVTFVNKQ
ncbi:restriction endonuclease [Candidatus Peregrinibacteria bacterium CG1_02_54_53]|nr:MAG: restriction endonuclease [Candidatus Peregrinibacteria bacterium CG1_02_54_53]